MEEKFQKATFASGCFWCGEAIFEELEGVVSVVSGYAGPSTHSTNAQGGEQSRTTSSGQAPTYEQVSTGKTEYAEVIQITFDQDKISYLELNIYN